MTKTHNKTTKTLSKIKMKPENMYIKNRIQNINKNYNSISVIIK